jgi:glycosyltransferase involved in cell wall biosynthesis
VRVIYNGVCLETCCNHSTDTGGAAGDGLGIPAGRRVIGFIGRLSPEKGAAFLLRAANEVLKAYPNAHFLMVGDGPQRDNLVNLSHSLGIDRHVTFAGIRRDVGKLLELVDVVVIPSLTEGLPMTLLEAMASRRPVISTRVGAIPDVIDHGINGVLIEPGDVPQLADSIISLLNNTRQANTLAQRGYEKVSRYFSSRVMAGQYADVYRRCLQTNTHGV